MDLLDDYYVVEVVEEVAPKRMMDEQEPIDRTGGTGVVVVVVVFGIRGRPPRHHPFHKNHHFRGHWNGRNRSVVGVAPAVMSIVVVVILTSAWTTMALDRSTTATAALAWPYSGAARKSTSSSGPRRRRGGYGRWYKRRPRDYPAEGTEVESSPPHTGSRSGPKEALRVSVTPPKHVPHQASMQRLLANEKVMRA